MAINTEKPEKIVTTFSISATDILKGTLEQALDLVKIEFVSREQDMRDYVREFYKNNHD